jgi:hypothetical protein
MWFHHHGTIGKIDVKLIKRTRTIVKTTMFTFINRCTFNNAWQMGQSMVGVSKKCFTKNPMDPPSIEDVLKNLMVHSYLLFIVSYIHTLFMYYYMQIVFSLNKFKDS